MKAVDVLQKLSFSMTLPYGVLVRSANNLIEEMQTNRKLTYDGPGRFRTESWYLEISSRYETLSMMKEFSSPDVICRDYDGSYQYFLIEN